MSAKENRRAAIAILTEQLCRTTFDFYDDKLEESPTLDMFISRFEWILAAIDTLTNATFPDVARRTMLMAQLRGVTAQKVCVERAEEFRAMNYEEFKRRLATVMKEGR
jgi:hypothetical protein